MKPKQHFARSLKTPIVLTASLVVCLSNGAMAQTADNWTGTISGDWNNAANWSEGVVPTKAGNYHAVINTSAPNVATITLGIIPPVDIIIGSGSGNNGRLDHPSGEGSTGSGNWMYVGTAGGTGVYNLAKTDEPGAGISGFATGSGSMSTNGGRFYVGGWTSSGSNGTVNINTTGALTVGSEFNISADGGTGVVNLENGTITSNDWTRVGGGAGSNGTLNMVGGTFNKQGGNNFVIGGTGSTGIANVSGGAINVNNEFWVANSGGSKGTLNFSGGTITTNSWTCIGRAGATLGKIVMTGGTLNKAGGGNFLVGDGSPGQLDLSGGSVTVNGQVWVGQGGGSNGTFNLSSGGSISNNSWVAVGREGGTGTVNMTGGTWTKTDGGSAFIVASSGPGTFNQSGGLVDVQQGETWMGESGSGSYSLSGSGEIRAGYFQVARNGSSTVTVNLDGGTLQATQIAGGGGNSTVNFNGTQIISKAGGNFISGLTSAIVKSGGLKIDSAGFNLTAPQLLVAGSPSGGLIKSGAGTLNLSAANTYTGATGINGGKLSISTASLANGAVTLADSTALGIIQTTDNQAYSASAVTFGATDATTLDFDLGSYAGNTANAPLNVTGSGALTLNGAVTVNVTDNLPVVGTVPLVSYTGGKTGSGSFQLGTIPDGVVANLTDNGTNQVALNVTRVNDAYWTGVVTVGINEVPNNEWNFTNANWKDDYTETASIYADGDPVTFDDRVVDPATDVTVMLFSTVSPGGSGVTFANATKNYTIWGIGKISGNTKLTKQGAGTATIDTINDYTGVTSLNGGTLKVGTLTNGGIASSIGAADNSEANITFNGGTLHYTGAATTIDRGFTTTGGNGGILTENDLTMSGVAASTSAGNFTKSGAGNLKFTADGVNIFGGGGAAGITVANGPLTFDGTGTSQINSVVNDIWVGTTASAGGSLLLENTTVSASTNGYLAIARGSGTTGLTSTCTLNNSTLTTGNLSLGYANGVGGYLATSVLTLNNSTYTMPGICRLAESGGATGTVNLHGASVMSSGETNIAQDSGSNGTLNINDTSVYTSNNRLQVGPATGSAGNVVISGSGSMIVNAYVSVGYNGGGSMTVKDNATLSNNDDFSVNENGAAPATVTLQDNGSISAAGVVFVGRGAGRVGTLTQTGGTFTGSGNEFQIGKFGQGTWLQSGGVTNAGGWVSIGRETSGTGVLTVSGTGSFIQTGTDRGLVVGELGSGTLNVQGTASVSCLGSTGVIVANGGTGVGVVNLDGGTLQSVRIADGGGNGTFNFNGGKLLAGTGSTPTFMAGLDAAYVKSGGANIDSNGETIAIDQDLLDGSGGGGLTKTGAGTLSLNGASTYTGATTVNAGTLGGTGTVAGPLLVSASATLAPGASAGTFTAGATTIAGTYACEIDGSNCDKLVSNGTLDISAATLAITEINPAGASPLVIASYTGSAPAPFATVTGVPSGYTLDYSYGGNSIALIQTATPYSTWINGFTTIPVGDRDPGDDPDGDGVSNIAEFALNGNPASGASTGKVVGKVAAVGGNPTLVLTLPVRAGATFAGTTEQVSALIDGVIYRIQGSYQLSTWDLAVSEVLGADKTTIESSLPALDSGWTYRTFQSPGSVSGDPADFLRAVIESP